MPNEESTSSCQGPDFAMSSSSSALSSSASSPGKRKQPIRPVWCVRRDTPRNEESTSSCPGPDFAMSSSASSPSLGKRKQWIRPVRGDSPPNEGASLGKRQQPHRLARSAIPPNRLAGLAGTSGLISATKPSIEDPKIIVGIDFGTMGSGFAYSLKADLDEKVFTFYNWPCLTEAGSKLHCKTQTSLWYTPVTTEGGGKRFELKDWGWTAFVNYKQHLQSRNADLKDIASSSSGLRRKRGLEETRGHFLTKFKLCLGSDSDQEQKVELPEGITAERVISDYLKQFSIFIMEKLAKRVGKLARKQDMKWCLTIPTSWTDAAKQSMIDCAEMAGLVRGRFCQSEDASRHKMVLIVEPEAASAYCQQNMNDTYNFRKGSKFLVVVAGGGMVELVVHEKLDDVSLKWKEVTYVESEGEGSHLCGGTSVDLAFMEFLKRKIKCFEQCSKDCPATVLTVKTSWEVLKCNFDGNSSHDMSLPRRLATAWKNLSKSEGTWTPNRRYDVLRVTKEDMQSIFDGQVNKILSLIHNQLHHVTGIEAVMVVGGFSKSRYLMKRIHERFSSKVKHIRSVTDPEVAVCGGAVIIGRSLGQDITVSRK